MTWKLTRGINRKLKEKYYKFFYFTYIDKKRNMNSKFAAEARLSWFYKGCLSKVILSIIHNLIGKT